MTHSTLGFLFAVTLVGAISSGCVDNENPFVNHVRVCGQVLDKNSGRPIQGESASFLLQVRNKNNGYLYDKEVPVFLNGNTGIGCATFDLGNVSAYLDRLELQDLTAYARGYAARATINQHHGDDLAEAIWIDAIFDLSHPEAGGKVQWAKYIIKEKLKRKKDQPAAVAISDDSETKDIPTASSSMHSSAGLEGSLVR